MSMKTSVFNKFAFDILSCTASSFFDSYFSIGRNEKLYRRRQEEKRVMVEFNRANFD